jgi:hypothetical protein
MIKIATTVLFFTAAANADFVVVNNPVIDTVGFYSDAFSSNGAYTYAQSGAQGFDLEDTYTTSSIKWWGSMNGFNGQGLSNISGFDIIIWSPSFDEQVVSQSMSMDYVSISKTGDYNFFGQPVYEFTVQFTKLLSAGSYYMNIGASLNDVSGDQFVWSQGQAVNDFWFTDDNGQYNWGDWRKLPNTFVGNTAGGAFVMTAPAPGVVALLGLAGLVAKRRR